MVTPDRKVRKLMREYEKTGNLSKAAIRADLDRKTARKYLRAGKMPSQMAVFSPLPTCTPPALFAIRLRVVVDTTDTTSQRPGRDTTPQGDPQPGRTSFPGRGGEAGVIF